MHVVFKTEWSFGEIEEDKRITFKKKERSKNIPNQWTHFPEATCVSVVAHHAKKRKSCCHEAICLWVKTAAAPWKNKRGGVFLLGTKQFKRLLVLDKFYNVRAESQGENSPAAKAPNYCSSDHDLTSLWPTHPQLLLSVINKDVEPGGRPAPFAWFVSMWVIAQNFLQAHWLSVLTSTCDN